MEISKLSPCGEDCTKCRHYSTECKGCRSNGGKCVKMWENGCKIYSCCEKHEVMFCGLCSEFPCKWVEENTAWNENYIDNQRKIAEIYRMEQEK